MSDAQHVITILQFRTDVSLDHERKCFEEFFGLPKEKIKYISVFQHEMSYDEIFEFLKHDTKPLIIAGSGQYYLSKENDTPEMQGHVDELKEKFYPIVRYLVEKNDRYIFAICFGHQILVDTFGKLGTDLEQAETGIFSVTLNKAGQNCELFSHISNPFDVVLGHYDSTIEVPKNAVVLASSDRCQVQALQFTDKIYSVQFHPELTLALLKERMKLYAHYLDHTSEDSFKDDLHDTQDATQILHNFLDIAGVKADS